MKLLRICLIAKESTDLEIFRQVAAKFDCLHVTYVSGVEQVLEAAHRHTFDLLISDKRLEKTDTAKINKIIDWIYPEAATLHLRMEDGDLIRYKLAEMIQKWQESRSGNPIRYLDNSGFLLPG